MERILDIAKYLTKKYKDEKKEEIDELKLHKILYFSQKEYIMLINWLFIWRGFWRLVWCDDVWIVKKNEKYFITTIRKCPP